MKKLDLQKIIREEIGKVISEAPVADTYFDVYIAKQDTVVKNLNSTRKIEVPKGTVISAVGGGVWRSTNSKIQTGINSLKNNNAFEVINNPIRSVVVDLANDIEYWGEDTNSLIEKDPANAKKIIADRLKIINSIKNLIK
jgi:hypothetical protein